MNVLGIDIGGSGIKAAVVDVTKGKMITPRIRVETPSPAKPVPVARAVAKVAKEFSWNGPIGVGFPGIIRHQVAFSAANLHPDWIGLDLSERFGRSTKCPVRVINDADAAGLAEMAAGAGRKRRGTVLLLTLGTGIGSALFRDGVLVPNTEFGHLKFGKSVAEKCAAASVREEKKMSWKHWSLRLNKLLLHLDFLLSPDLCLIGGGVSKKFEKMAPFFAKELNVIPAQLRNEAGIIGAALAAVHGLTKKQLVVRSFKAPEAD